MHIQRAVPTNSEPIKISQRHFWTSHGIYFQSVTKKFKLNNLSNDNFQASPPPPDHGIYHVPKAQICFLQSSLRSYLCCRAVLMWLRWKNLQYFNFVILKLISIIMLMLFHAPKAQISFRWSLLRFYLYCREALMWLKWKKAKYFNFVILKLIYIFGFMLFYAPKAQFFSL